MRASRKFLLFLHPDNRKGIPQRRGTGPRPVVHATAQTLCQANLAQLVEHFIRNERVVGSIPIVGSCL